MEHLYPDPATRKHIPPKGNRKTTSSSKLPTIVGDMSVSGRIFQQKFAGIQKCQGFYELQLFKAIFEGGNSCYSYISRIHPFIRLFLVRNLFHLTKKVLEMFGGWLGWKNKTLQFHSVGFVAFTTTTFIYHPPQKIYPTKNPAFLRVWGVVCFTIPIPANKKHIGPPQKTAT